MPIPLILPLLAIAGVAMAAVAGDSKPSGNASTSNSQAFWDELRFWFVNPQPNNPLVLTGYRFGELGHPASAQEWAIMCVNNNLDVLMANSGPEYKRAPDGTQYQVRYFLSRVKGTAENLPGWTVLYKAGSQLPAPNGPGSGATPYNAQGFAQWGDFLKRFFASLASVQGQGQSQGLLGGGGYSGGGIPIFVPQGPPPAQTPPAQTPSGTGNAALDAILAAINGGGAAAGQTPPAQTPPAMGYVPSTEMASMVATLSNELGGVFIMRQLGASSSNPTEKVWLLAQAQNAYEKQRASAIAKQGTFWKVREGDLAYRVSDYYGGTLSEMAKCSKVTIKGLESAKSWRLPLDWDVEAKERLGPMATPDGAAVVKAATAQGKPSTKVNDPLKRTAENYSPKSKVRS